ncbi:hypothetical protein StoSoilB19_14900 [Arthrobacter sp. StoSoilB19]|nr:hypothetical protein StoSoilB19_14900 [Arthrobacter sp. StoSoilB19]
MVNSVTPMPTPPMARAKIAMPMLGVVLRVAVDGERTLLIFLLLETWDSQGTDATAVGQDGPDSVANPGWAGPIPGRNCS